MATIDRIIERAQKLRNLADNAGTIDEAAVAAQKLQELLFKHNLDMATLDTSDPGAGIGGVVSEEYNLGGEGGQVTWQRTLLGTIADWNFCRTVIWTGSDKAAIVGEPHNIAVVAGMYEYLKLALMGLAEKGYRADKAAGRTNATKRKYSYWFYRGAIVEIYRRLEEQRRRDETDVDTTALVAVDDQLDAAFDEMFPNTQPAHTRETKRADAAAVEAGRHAGNSVALDPQVKDGRDAARLGA